jgi:4'-phosphopantetheinyl transferase
MDWPVPPALPPLQPDLVQVWRANLQAPEQVEPLFSLLSADEQARAQRFYFAKDHDRFTLARGILRLLLGRYLNRAPETVQFEYGAVGKPALANLENFEATEACHPLCFNVSHSHQMALFALAQREVGVDLEQIRADCDGEAIAARFFSPQEQAALNRLSPELRPRGFFNGWTRKEALLKAMGTGLTFPLDQLEVSLTPGEPTQIRQLAHPGSWLLADLSFETDRDSYAAAVAAAGQDWRVETWQFSLDQFGF